MTRKEARELLRQHLASMADEPPPIDRGALMRAYVAVAQAGCGRARETAMRAAPSLPARRPGGDTARDRLHDTPWGVGAHGDARLR